MYFAPVRFGAGSTVSWPPFLNGSIIGAQAFTHASSASVSSGVSHSPMQWQIHRACRAVIAARQQWPGSEWRVFRTLQLANFNTPLLFDDDEQMRDALALLPGVDADRIVALIDDPEVLTAYERDKAETRTAAGSPTERQGKEGRSDGVARYSAPSLVFEMSDGRRLEAGAVAAF